MSKTTYSKLVDTRSSKSRHNVGIERTHLGRPVLGGNDRETGRMIREHHFQQLPVETIRTRLDFRKVETRLKIEIVGDRAMLKVEVDEAGRGLRARATAVKQDHRRLHGKRRHAGTADGRQKCVDLGFGRFGAPAGALGHACAGADQIDRLDRLHQKISNTHLQQNARYVFIETLGHRDDRRPIADPCHQPRKSGHLFRAAGIEIEHHDGRIRHLERVALLSEPAGNDRKLDRRRRGKGRTH
jgi:hypothetical protein